LVNKPALLYIFATCPYLIETLPALAMDKRKPEDADSTGNDHACDALRYLCKARLIDSQWEQPPEVLNKGIIKLQAYIAQMRARANRPTI
jgi:hypothetical protein